MNHCIQRLGLDLLQEFYNDIDNNLPIVSAGSGLGWIEYKLFHDPSNKKRKEIICVDPSPNSWQKKDDLSAFGGKGMSPQFATCKDLLASRKDIVGKCNLLLIWPYPNGSGRYDVEFILELKPKKILLVIESTGSAGSDMLYTFLQKRVSRFQSFRVFGDLFFVEELEDRSADHKYHDPEVHEFFTKMKAFRKTYHMEKSTVKHEEGESFDDTHNYRYLLLSDVKPLYVVEQKVL